MSFPRYPSYKDSGVEWLGEVPEHWSVEPFKRQIERNDGGVWGDDPDGVADTIVLRSTEQTVDGRWQLDDPAPRKLSEADINGSLLVEGDLLLTKSSGSSLHIGKTTLVTEEIAEMRCCYSNFMQRIRTRPSFSPKLAWHVLNNDLARRQFDLLSNSTTGLANLNAAMVGQILVPVPPIAEQTAIAEFLDRETGKIDELVAEQRRLMELLNEQIISLVLSSFGSPETRELRLSQASTIISRPVIQKPDESYTRIGLFNRGRGLFHKDASEMDDMGESDFFWIEEGDLIISGQFAWEGAVALADKEDTGCVVSHRYPVIRGKDGVALTEYLLGLFCTSHGDFLLNENSRGAAGRNRPLNIESLMKEKIPVPNMEIQLAVARAVHTRKVLFKDIAATIDLLQERRTALISAAVTGQIDVRQLATAA